MIAENCTVFKGFETDMYTRKPVLEREEEMAEVTGVNGRPSCFGFRWA